MKTIRIILLAMIPMLFLGTGCYKEGNIFGIRGTGSFYEEDRYVDSWERLDLGISADVYLTQDQNESITIEAQANILDNIETYVSGSTLKIRFKRHVLSHEGITIYISNSVYRELEISGSGSVVNSTPIDCNDLDLRISGSGNINLADVDVAKDLQQNISGSGNIHVENLEVGNDIHTTISGSGKVYNEGSVTADYMKVNISGSGSVNALELPVDRVRVVISGSGNCKVWAVSELDVTISGSGSVYYTGNPVINTTISGSGRVYLID